MPNVIHPPSYHAPICCLAWRAAGWRARVTDAGAVESWGPESVTRTVALDMLDILGCLDSRL